MTVNLERKGPKLPGWYPPEMTKDEIIKWVREYRAGHIFTCFDIPSDMQASVFMVLAFADLRKVSRSVLETLCWYEHIDKAGPLAVNGWPTFFSLKWMRVSDLRRAQKYEVALKEAEQKALEAMEE